MSEQHPDRDRSAVIAADREFRIFPKTWGSDYIREGEVRFRLWAPEVETVALRLDGRDQQMSPAGGGWFELLATGIAPDARYQFVLPGGRAVPDPASRAQAGGVEGPSIVTDPTAYRWCHPEWQGLPWEAAVLYELHIGTFTPEGTFQAAIGKLAHLADLGITAIEVMPVAEFPGERGWGYDGVLIYAPHHAYGAPDDFKAFIDAAHGHGIMVILDVVYNHFGPEGNWLPTYAGSFFDPGRQTPWGGAIDFTASAVRDFFVDNALYWLLEFNLDGLRIDAVHAIEDRKSETHIISELANRVRAECHGRRRHLIVEDSRNITRFLKREDGLANTIDAGWNDDFHHTAHIIATGEAGGHLSAFAANRFRNLGIALAEGYVLAGDEPVALPGGETVSAPALLPPSAYVLFLQNHDQIGNRAYGDRLNAIAGRDMLSVMEAIVLLSPSIPLLFMGDEYAETRPFRFFCDYTGATAGAFRHGRLAEAISFGSLPDGANPDDLPDPNAEDTFHASKLDWCHATTATGTAKLDEIRTLLTKRKKHLVPLLQGAGGRSGTLHRHENGVYAVDWQLAGALWQLRANLTEAAADLHPFTGDVIHVYPKDSIVSGQQIGPLTVLFAKRA